MAGWAGAGAVAAGFVAIVLGSFIVDEVLHLLGVYPPWSEPLYDTKLLVLATAYRAVITLGGGWLTARLAPRTPMRYVRILAGLGLLGGIAGIAGAATHQPSLGPLWYPIAVAVTGPPAALWGGSLLSRR